MIYNSIFTRTAIAVPSLFSIYGLLIRKYDILFNSLYTLLLISVVLFFQKKFLFFKKSNFYGIIIFILLSVFAGKTLRFYFTVPHWDKILHFLSGFIIASVGNQIFNKKAENNTNNILKKLFILSFAVASAGIWEFFEFLSDNIIGTNSQNNSLTDTMLDMIAGSTSALLYIIYKFFSSL